MTLESALTVGLFSNIFLIQQSLFSLQSQAENIFEAVQTESVKKTENQLGAMILNSLLSKALLVGILGLLVSGEARNKSCSG